MTILGDHIDSEHPLIYGPWTVAFDHNKPEASYNCPENTLCYIMISNLKCVRASSGSLPCGLKLYADATCKLIIPFREEAVLVQCPLHVALEPAGARVSDSLSKM
jgi:hypothetical protein